MDAYYNLDTACWLQPGKDVLLLSGWCFAAESTGGNWEQVRLRSGSQIHLAYYGLLRPDVQQAYPAQSHALFSGFSILIFDAGIQFPCALEARDPEGRWTPFLEIAADRIPPPPASPRPGVDAAATIERKARATTGEKPVLFISHDFAYAGAQLILLRLLRWLKPRAPFPFEILVNVPRSSAALASASERHVLEGFHEVAPVHFLSDLSGAPENLPLIRAGHYSLIYANTSTLGVLLAAMQPCPSPVISHVYELAFWIDRRTGREVFARQATNTAHFVAVARAVRNMLVDRYGIAPAKVDVIYACASMERAEAVRRQHTRESVRRELKIPADTFVIQACGSFDWRKGADLFVPLCIALRRRLGPRKFKAIWIGDHGPALIKDQFEHEVEFAGLTGVVELVPPQHNLPWWMLAADCFVLPSREEPFAMVMLEAGALGLPVVGFAGSGGIEEYAESGAGLVVPYLDLEAFADVLAALSRAPARREEIGRIAAQTVARNYDREISFQQTLDLISARRVTTR
jgi:glycosyltransferase involved in cell wall biosynthesis